MPGLVKSVTNAFANVNLVTLQDVKDDLALTGTASDAYLGRVITRASRIITDYCGRRLGMATVDELFRFGFSPGNGAPWSMVAPYGTPLNLTYKPLILSRCPIVSVVSISENGGAALVQNTDFEVDAGAGLVYRLRGGVRGAWYAPTIEVVYTSGFQLPDDTATSGAEMLPDSVQSVCIALIKSGFSDQGADPSVLREVVEGAGRVDYAPRGMPAMFVDATSALVLEPYRLHT